LSIDAVKPFGISANPDGRKVPPLLGHYQNVMAEHPIGAEQRICTKPRIPMKYKTILFSPISRSFYTQTKGAVSASFDHRSTKQ
jgi:hypothetical protein